MGDNEFIFLASGDACEVCQSLDGTACTALPHQNCQCSCQPKPPDCNWTTNFFGPDEIEPGRFSMGAEVTVTCPDGSELGKTVQYIYELGDDSPAFSFELEEAEESLCDECHPAEEPFNCC